jgi:hypothetical protein
MSEEAESRQGSKLQLAIALAKGHSMGGWARANGVAKSTAQRWSQEPEVRAEIDAFRRRAIARAVGVFTMHSHWAAKEIYALAKSAESESVKLRALQAVVGDMMAVSRHSVLDERMAELEAYVKEQRGAGASSPPDFQA